MMRLPLTRFLSLVGAIAFAPGLSAQTFTQEQSIDFFRDVSSRHLSGLGTRSDGRLIVGPEVRRLRGDLPPALLWDLAPREDGSLLVGTGPDARILRLRPDASADTFTVETWAELGSGQIYALTVLADGSVVAGVSPGGRLVHLAADGGIRNELVLPAESIFHLLAAPESAAPAVWIATGHPGRVFHLDLARLAASDVAAPAMERGLSVWGEIRDRNVRRLALDPQGRLLAGSAPEGNLYRFAAAGAAPEILFDHERAEVTDLHVAATGDIFATVVFAGDESNQRVARGTPPLEETERPKDGNSTPPPGPTILEAAPTAAAFSGRTHLVRLPGGDGLAETVASRADTSLYRIQPRGGLLLLAGGDEGELLGYDTAAHRSLTYAGSESAQINALVPVAGDPDAYWALGNNPAALLRVDYAVRTPRRATTRRIDLRTDGRLGALRFNRLRDVAAPDIGVELRSNRGRDELEGWSAWTGAREDEGGWRTKESLRGHYVQVRITLPADLPATAELDRARLFHLPQNRRPVLQTFHVVPPDLALVPRSEGGNTNLPTLGQLIGNAGNTNDGRNANPLLASPVVPEPGAQIVTWTVRDADDDRLVATFAVRHEDEADWITLAERTPDNWVQFDRRTLREGLYFTRLTVAETSPRPAAERLEVAFETDDLMVDLSPPVLTAPTAAWTADAARLALAVTVEDALTLPQSVEFVFNNGHRAATGHPDDGLLDGRKERFSLLLEAGDLAGATAVEMHAEDATGNRGSRRVVLPLRP